MTSTTIVNENLSMPPNTHSPTTINNQSPPNNCGLNQQAESFVNHHYPVNPQDVSQVHNPSIAVPSALNASSTFYTHTSNFAMQSFAPIPSSNPIVAVSTALATCSNGGIHSPVLYASKVPLSGSGGFCYNNDENGNLATSAFVEPLQQSTAVGGLGASNEDNSVNSSSSGSLAGSNCSAVSSCSDNGGTSSSGSMSSLTSASQYELYHANSSYSKYGQTDMKSEANGHYNEKYLHAFSESDIALATKPGAQMYFDPSLCHFSDEDLRPQPMNKKSRKQTVPDCQKDDKYWARRAKNNVAAKKSREQRRLKENQVLLRASYLEKQNQALRVELQILRCEHAKLANYLPS